MLSQSYWLQLPPETRQKVAHALNIRRSGGTVVEGNRVVSDGYTPDDLYEVKVEKLQQFTGSDSTDFYKLFDLAVKMIENPMIEVKGQVDLNEVVKPGEVLQIPNITIKKELSISELLPADKILVNEEKSQPKKRGRPAKKI